jgi:hypothetical protein
MANFLMDDPKLPIPSYRYLAPKTATYTNTPKLTQKDNFHNLIFCIDKMVNFAIADLTILTKLSLS